jgi:hypothetical protein
MMGECSDSKRMSMKSNRFRTIVTGLAAMAVLLLLGASARIARADFFGSGGTLHRLVADYQNSTTLGPAGEISSNVLPGPLGTGGTVTYTKSVSIPDNAVFITLTTRSLSRFRLRATRTAGRRC